MSDKNTQQTQVEDKDKTFVQPVDQKKLAAEEKLKLEKPHKCPLCEYRAKLPSLLSRHVNHFHAEKLERNPQQLLKIMEKKKNVPELLSAVAQWIEQGSTFDEYLPEDVVAYLRKEDAKTQLLLRIIAIEKVQRALSLGEKIKSLDADLTKRLDDPKWREKADAHGLMSMVERLQDIQLKELGFLKELSQLGQVNLNDVIDKLLDAFGTSKLGTVKTGTTAFQITGVNIPDDPVEREKLRKVLTGMGVGNLIKNNGNTGRPITTVMPCQPESAIQDLT